MTSSLKSQRQTLQREVQITNNHYGKVSPRSVSTLYAKLVRLIGNFKRTRTCLRACSFGELSPWADGFDYVMVVGAGRKRKLHHEGAGAPAGASAAATRRGRPALPWAAEWRRQKTTWTVPWRPLPWRTGTRNPLRAAEEDSLPSGVCNIQGRIICVCVCGGGGLRHAPPLGGKIIIYRVDQKTGLFWACDFWWLKCVV